MSKPSQLFLPVRTPVTTEVHCFNNENINIEKTLSPSAAVPVAGLSAASLPCIPPATFWPLDPRPEVGPPESEAT